MESEHQFGFRQIEEPVADNTQYIENHTYICLTLRSVLIVVSLIVGFGYLLRWVI